MSEPRREDIAPVFAEFGSACFQAHLLEDALRLLLRAGREHASVQVSDAAIRYPTDPEGLKTLGALFHDVLSVEVVSDRDRRYIWQAIRTRNRLTHDYWSVATAPQNSVLLMTPDGRLEVIKDLRRLWRCLREATRLVHNMLDTYLAAYGLSMQQIMDRTSAIYAGDHDEPEPEDLIQ